MNLVFVFDGLQVGGIERVGVDYISLLIQKGYNVSVVNLVPSLNELYFQLPENCDIYEINLPRTLVPYRYAKGVEKGIAGAIAYAMVGSVLSVLFFLYRIFCMIKLRKLCNTEVLIAFSGHFNDLMFVASGYVPGKKIAWLHGSEFEYKILSEGYFVLYKKIKNLVCLSELCDITCNKFNTENNIKKTKIYNPILIRNNELDDNKIKQLKAKYGEFALMAARLDPDKDQKTAILAIKFVNEKRNGKIHLLLAGDGKNRQILVDFVAEQEAEAYVHFLGNCLDIQNYYAAAHVYVHSSPMEGLPTVLLEALAFNLPIAATDSLPGVREILKDNEYGLISPVGNWKALGKNIERLYNEEELRKRFKERGQKRVKDFAPEIAVKELEAFIQSI